MLLILSEFSTLASAFKLILLLVVFFILLYAAHLFTKWYAKSNFVNAKSSNISIIESQQVSPGKSIVIAKVGEKYVSFLMMKENAVFLTELEKEEITFSPPKEQNISFSEALKKVANAKKKNNGNI